MLQSFPAALRIDNPVSGVTGPQDSVQAINTTKLPNGSVVLCNATNSFYELRKESGATASGSTIVAPSAGPGRWFDMGRGAVGIQDVALGYPELAPNSGDDTASVPVVGVVDGDVLAVVITDTGLPNALVIGLPRITGAGTALWSVYNVSGATIAGGTVNLRVAILPG